MEGVNILQSRSGKAIRRVETGEAQCSMMQRLWKAIFLMGTTFLKQMIEGLSNVWNFTIHLSMEVGLTSQK